MDPLDALVKNDRPHEVPSEISARIEARMFGALARELSSEAPSDPDDVVVVLDADARAPRRRSRVLLVAVGAALVVLVLGAAIVLRPARAPDQQVAAVTSPTPASTATPRAATTPSPAPVVDDLVDMLDAYCDATRVDLNGISWRGEEVLRTWPLIRDQHAELAAVVRQALQALPTVSAAVAEPVALSRARSEIVGIDDRMTDYARTFTTNSWETVADDIPAELANLVEVLDGLTVLGARSCAAQ